MERSGVSFYLAVQHEFKFCKCHSLNCQMRKSNDVHCLTKDPTLKQVSRRLWAYAQDVYFFSPK